MPKKKTAAVVGAVAVLGIGIWAAYAFAGDDKSKTKWLDVKPTPDDDDDDDSRFVKTDDDFKFAKKTEIVKHVDSPTVCFRDGLPYNMQTSGTPEKTVDALRFIGVPIGLVELLQSDAMASTPVFAASHGYKQAGNKRPSDRLKMFQAKARELKLPGHETAGASAVDGWWGECTARSLDAALTRARVGQWPWPPVMAAAASSPMQMG